MNDFHLGWVVGIVEGEGWIGNRQGRPHVTVAMTDLDVVRSLADRTGLGHVHGPHIPTDGRKPSWRWSITARDDGARFLREILPHMSERRAERIRSVLAAYEAAGPTRGTARVCGRGHDITPESGNLRLASDGRYTRRQCRKCAALRAAKYRAKASS